MRTKTRKKFKVLRKQSVYDLRTDLVQEHIARGIVTFLGGTKKSPCLVCGHEFEQRHRYHRLCGVDCAAIWNRGMIHPRS